MALCGAFGQLTYLTGLGSGAGCIGPVVLASCGCATGYTGLYAVDPITVAMLGLTVTCGTTGVVTVGVASVVVNVFRTLFGDCYFATKGADYVLGAVGLRT